MNHKHENLLLGGALLVTGLALYTAHYFTFHQFDQTLYYAAMDIAFIPIQLLIVGLIAERWLNAREKRRLLAKLNTVIGAFFGEAGQPLLRRLLAVDAAPQEICALLKLSGRWKTDDFRQAATALSRLSFDLKPGGEDLEQLRELLHAHRKFMMRLMENPNLLEHEMFTELLLAVFHLTEELSARQDLRQLPESDRIHLAKDAQRVYSLLVREWLSYMEYLKTAYPFLYSFAVRTNPFDPDACVTIPAPRPGFDETVTPVPRR